MKQDAIQEKQPWASCFLTNVLVSYMEDPSRGNTAIDYPSLFRGIEGFETPSDPRSFLQDVNNWVPLTILRELLWQCEEISGRKDIAYHAARAYFDPDKKDLLSLFKIIFRVLNDVRSVLICSNLWAAVQTNYLKLQSFERQDPPSNLYMLALFPENARPAVGSIHFLRGLCEGFARLYSFIHDVQCIEEISQLQIEDIVREFPDFSMASDGNRLSVRKRYARDAIVEAVKIALRSEVLAVSPEFTVTRPDEMVVVPRDGQITVLTDAEEGDPKQESGTVRAYKIVRPGVVSHGALSYLFPNGRVYNAPYSRFRFVWKESEKSQGGSPGEIVRREVSRLLFDHLSQIKEAQMRVVQSNIEKGQLRLENIQLRREIEREYSFAGIIGQSPKMQELFSVIRSLAETDVTGLIQGETGTGKELIARAIHYNSPRKAKRFVAINCAALSETLLESELFGHEKGAFTGAITQRKGIFEVADGGTLFLDEIGEIPPTTQVKLLRVLQEGEFQRVGGTTPIRVDVRILSATNQDLEDLVKKGRFRQDLYYRLNVFPLRVPPLSDRPEDIPLLVSRVIGESNRRMNKHIAGVSPQVMALLMAYSWPGNVRELENVIQRMMVVAKRETLDVEDLPSEIRGREEGRAEKLKDLKDIARESAELAEKRTIVEALSKTGGNITKAAKALGISRATLQKRMKAYGLRSSRE